MSAVFPPAKEGGAGGSFLTDSVTAEQQRGLRPEREHAGFGLLPVQCRASVGILKLVVSQTFTGTGSQATGARSHVRSPVRTARSRRHSGRRLTLQLRDLCHTPLTNFIANLLCTLTVSYRKAVTAFDKSAGIGSQAPKSYRRPALRFDSRSSGHLMSALPSRDGLQALAVVLGVRT